MRERWCCMTSMCDENRISFIMCVNDDRYAAECETYIRDLCIPDGFNTDVLMVREAVSMAAGYNEGMTASQAKYKIYLHQDVMIREKDILIHILDLFRDDPMIVGNTVLPEDGIPWGEGGCRIGGVYTDYISGCEDRMLGIPLKPCQDVKVVDGLFMATQIDLPWREDIFDGWHFYDLSQSMEYHRAGYRVVVPYMETPWCFHDNDIHYLGEDYHHYRKVFLQEYS